MSLKKIGEKSTLNILLKKAISTKGKIHFSLLNLLSYKLKNYYTIIIPVNNEIYLQELVDSLPGSTGTTNNIEIIVIDYSSHGINFDALTHHPSLELSIHKSPKPNLAAARNLGLALARHPWITFPNQTDFFHIHYLRFLDKAAIMHSDYSILSCRRIRYQEQTGLNRDDLPGRERFKGGRAAMLAQDLENLYETYLESCVLNKNHIKELSLQFDETVGDGFDGVRLLNELLLKRRDAKIAFLPSARYMLRDSDRIPKINTLHPTNSDWFLKQSQSWTRLLSMAESDAAHTPNFAYHALIHDIVQHVKYHIENTNIQSSIKPEDLENYVRNIESTLQKTPAALRQQGKLLGDYFLRVGILHAFCEEPFNAIANIDEFDEELLLIKVRYLSQSSTPDALAYIDSSLATQKYHKTRQIIFCGRTLYYTHSFWMKYSGGHIDLIQGGYPLLLTTEKRRLKALLGRPRLNLANATPSQESKPCWVIADKPDKADDNGEHFYRYLLNNHPEIEAYFVLQANSRDAARLKAEGFLLLEPGSKELLRILRRCDWVISSHGENYIRQRFNGKIKRTDYKFAFLQHGVTKDDQSSWFNNMKPEVVSTSTKAEFESIVNINSKYNQTELETILSEQPRYDRLIRIDRKSKTIFIFPTWRKNLTARTNGSKWTLIEDFGSSNFVMKWRCLLNSDALKTIAEKNQLNIVFCPHPNASESLEYFKIPKHIKVVSPNNIESVQPYLAEAAVLITDYSSIAFDAAYIDKPVIYYQFDEVEFFAGHTYDKGYFDYRRDGLGPVASNESEVIHALAIAVAKQEGSEYAKRRSEAFIYRNGRASERIYQALIGRQQI